MLHLAPDRGFGMLDHMIPVIGIVGYLLQAAGAAVDAIINRRKMLIRGDLFTLFDAKIPGVAVHDFVIFPYELWGNIHIMNIGWCDLYRVY